MSRLPEKLSDLLELAVKDAEACEQDPRYRLDMFTWHEPDLVDDERCYVCMAGAVMAQRLGCPPAGSPQNQEWFPGDYPRKVTLQLWAIDSMRQGQVPEAFQGTDLHERIDIALNPIREAYDKKLARAPWDAYLEAAERLRVGVPL